MARQTRQQRRASRAGQADGQSVGQRPRAPQQQQQVASASDHAPAPAARRGPGGGSRRFVAESWAELKKVEWPGQQQLIQGTAVVIVACVIVGVYLWGTDLVFKRLVQNVFLGQ